MRTEEELRRKHQGIDRPGVRKGNRGKWRQGKMEVTGCESICCVPTTIAVKGYMMIMMMMMMMMTCKNML